MISFGIDSSNYRSSVAAYYDNGNFVSERKLLPVALGQKGLRQSDAVFAHTKQLPHIVCSVLDKIDISLLRCVGVSDRPRRLEDSYMPCFLSGIALAEVLSSSLGVPLYRFSHQEGHIAAGLLSADRLDLFNRDFIAFHVSGGTTEALFVSPSDIGFRAKIIAKTLDLNLGQVIDRVGVMLGLPFPSGEELEKLALKGEVTYNLRPCIKGKDCALSGVENVCDKLFKKGELPENIAAFTLSYAAETLCAMALKLKKEYKNLPFVFLGGVMSDNIIKNRLLEVIDADFASPQLSGDNAVGIALLSKLQMEK